MRQLLLVLPVILTLLVSGCTTIPGVSEISKLLGISTGQTVEEKHDVIVIDSLQALPNNVPPGGSVKIVAIVSNVADVDAEITSMNDIHVELYDYCDGLFKLTGSEGGTGASGNKAARKINLLRGEKKQVEWTLEALSRKQVPVKTECTMKVLARYKYATRSVTTLHFIDYAEMQRRISEGTYKQVGSYQSIGYGPLKPYISVEGTQPIPVEKNKANIVLSYQIKNKGKGFLTTEDGKTTATGVLITEDLIKAGIKSDEQESFAKDIASKLSACITSYFSKEFSEATNREERGLKLIKGETPKIVCPSIDVSFQTGNVPVESTKLLHASVGTIKDRGVDKPYYYEFRKELKVTVEPKF